MKKIFLTYAFLLTLVNDGLCQGYYFDFGLGYQFPLAGQTLDGTGTPYSGTRNTTTYLQTYNMNVASFGAGPDGLIGFGYMFNNNVGVQLDASLGLSRKTYTFTDNNVSYSGYTATENINMQAAAPFCIIPSLVLQTGWDSKWNMYGRFGALLPIGARNITEDQIFYVPALSITDDYTIQIQSYFSLGMKASAGFQYQLNDRSSLWGELTFTSLSLFIKKATLKNVTENGYTIPLDSVGGPHVIQYSKNAAVDTNYANQPSYSQPFSSVGFRFGMNFNLSHHERSSGRKHRDEDIDPNQPYRRR